ncbi:hypothetical protein Dimus_015586 [Dionaea muscipula]
MAIAIIQSINSEIIKEANSFLYDKHIFHLRKGIIPLVTPAISPSPPHHADTTCFPSPSPPQPAITILAGAHHRGAGRSPTTHHCLQPISTSIINTRHRQSRLCFHYHYPLRAATHHHQVTIVSIVDRRPPITQSPPIDPPSADTLPTIAHLYSAHHRPPTEEGNDRSLFSITSRGRAQPTSPPLLHRTPPHH